MLGGVLLGGLTGEALRIEGRIAAVGDRLQSISARGDERSTVSEAFFTVSLLFCIGPLTSSARSRTVLPALVVAPALVGLVSAVR